MGGGGGPSNVTQTTTVKLPKWAEPYAKQLLERGSSLSQRPYSSISPENLFEPMAPETQIALGGITSRALAGSPVITQAQQELTKTLGGEYLYPQSNPFLEDLYNTAAKSVLHQYQLGVVPQLNAAASRAGAYGGSSHRLLQAEAAKNLTETLADMAVKMYGSNYERERANQLKSLFFAPTMAQQDYLDMQALLGVGDVYRQYGQDWRNLLAQEFYARRDWPVQQLGILASVLPAAVGGQGVTTTSQPNPYYASPWSRMFGGAVTGIGTGLLASMIPGVGPFAASILGLLPFLGSIF